MPRYLFNDYESSPDASTWTKVLMRAYAAKIRPTCLCKHSGDGARMYIAKVRDAHFIKRMPLTGAFHAPHCEHYEPPPELSGLGQVSGSAIREESDTNITNLSLDFALTKGRARPVGAGDDVKTESVRTDGTKLTMRATFHYLYDQAALTRWSPKMQGRRSWSVVRRELLKATADKIAKGSPLSELLFIPETFSVDEVGAIGNRRVASLARLSGSSSNRMLIVAPIRLVEQTRFGYKLTLKHLPDMPLMMNDDLHKRLMKVFADELALWGQIESTHLLLVGTISLSPQGFHVLESACLVNVNECWIPFDSLYEYLLLDSLHREDRRFTKGLRYNLPSDKPLASVVLQDTGEVSTALYVVPGDADDDYEPKAKELTDLSKMHSWFWHSTLAMPALPIRQLGEGESPPPRPVQHPSALGQPH